MSLSIVPAHLPSVEILQCFLSCTHRPLAEIKELVGEQSPAHAATSGAAGRWEHPLAQPRQQGHVGSGSELGGDTFAAVSDCDGKTHAWENPLIGGNPDQEWEREHAQISHSSPEHSSVQWTEQENQVTAGDV